jgi:dihydrofolate reductase
MTRLRFTISMSLDGYVAGPNQSVENPLGEGGMALHEWAFALRVWRREHGLDGGEDNASTPVVERNLAGIGAYVMGRNMFGGSGAWDENPWDGWWDDEPPFHRPVYVVTHHAREPLALEGGTTFHFVTDGVEAAIAQAREAAGDGDVVVSGGCSIGRYCLGHGLVDEATLSVVPILLHRGERLLDGLDGAQLGLECVEAVAAPGVTHLTYRRAAA